MRKLVVAAGLVCAMAAFPLSASAGAETVAKFKGRGSGTLTISGANFTIDGHLTVANVGYVDFHSEGSTTGGGTVAYTTTFTAPSGDTITTSSTGTARHTRIGRIFISRDTVTGGTGRFVTATGFGRTAAKANTNTGTVKFILAGKITY